MTAHVGNAAARSPGDREDHAALSETPGNPIARAVLAQVRRIYDARFGSSLPADDIGARLAEIVMDLIVFAGGNVTARLTNFVAMQCPWAGAAQRNEMVRAAIERKRWWWPDELGVALQLATAEQVAHRAWNIRPIDYDGAAHKERLATAKLQRDRDRHAAKRLSAKPRRTAPEKRLAAILPMLRASGDWVSTGALCRALKGQKGFLNLKGGTLRKSMHRAIDLGVQQGVIEDRLVALENGHGERMVRGVLTRSEGVSEACQTRASSLKKQGWRGDVTPCQNRASRISYNKGHGLAGRAQATMRGATPARRSEGPAAEADRPGRDLLSPDVAPTFSTTASSPNRAEGTIPLSGPVELTHSPDQVEPMNVPTNESEFRAYFVAELAKITTAEAVPPWFNSAEQKKLREACGITRPQLDWFLDEGYARIEQLRAAEGPEPRDP